MTRWRKGTGEGADAPSVRAERGERAGQAGEEGRLGMTGREGQAHGSGGFDDASGDFEQTKAQGHELGLGQIALFGNGVSDGSSISQ